LAIGRQALARESFDLAALGGRLAPVRAIPKLIADQVRRVVASPDWAAHTQDRPSRSAASVIPVTPGGDSVLGSAGDTSRADQAPTVRSRSRVVAPRPPSAACLGDRRQAHTAIDGTRIQPGLRGRLLVEGVGDGLLQGHRPALGPGGLECVVAAAGPRGASRLA
jgi:hypothetical protein